ncbi:AraC-like DNA-binding protein [Kitasatospora herbaricolor]|uniref:hypothetical protein n=1 Tax=Kitasatospora herbaricolor TaxID=68217 RepID=UPI00174D509E|nr:hypothetical protein [Kitasatospora herbaricolor]MDQ0306533.1 AraC-like DNA-binding protein [Kitasatospora herbaricolor]
MPDLVETLDVALVHRAAVELVTGRDCGLTLLGEDTTVLPLEAGWRRSPPGVLGGRLEWTGPPLPEIAAAAGSTDHPHLTRRFRERFGRTPQEFRAER